MKNRLTAAVLALSLAVPVVTMPAFAADPAEDVMDQLEQYYAITPVYTEDFENYSEDEPLNSMWSVKENCASPGKTPTDPQGTSLAVQAGGISGGTEVSLYLTSALSGTVLVKCDYYFTETDKHDKVILPMNDKDNRNENNVLEAKKNGTFTSPREGGKVLPVSYETGKWYEIAAVIDTDNRKIDLYINDELVVDNVDGNPSANGIRRIFAIKQWGESPVDTNYVDNFGIYTLQAYPTAEFSKAVAGDEEVTDAQAVPYKADQICVNLTTPFAADAVDGKISLNQDGQPVEFEGALSEDGMTYTMTLKELLKADSAYTIAFAPGITDKAGVGLVTEQLNLKTASNVVSRISLSSDGSAVSAGDTVTATANAVYISDAPTNEVLLMLVLYKDNRFVQVAYINETITEDKELSVSLDVPDEAGNYTVKAFAWDNAADMNAYTN